METTELEQTMAIGAEMAEAEGPAESEPYVDAGDTEPSETVPGGWEPGDDESLAPEGAFLGTAKLSGQIGLLPETCAVKFAGTTGLEGQFNIGERVKFTAEAIVSGDNASGKVKDGELQPVGKTQTLTILSAERV